MRFWNEGLIIDCFFSRSNQEMINVTVLLLVSSLLVLLASLAAFGWVIRIVKKTKQN